MKGLDKRFSYYLLMDIIGDVSEQADQFWVMTRLQIKTRRLVDNRERLCYSVDTNQKDILFDSKC